MSPHFIYQQVYISLYMHLQYCTHLCNELDDLDEDVERCVLWYDDLCTPWKETADNTL